MSEPQRSSATTNGSKDSLGSRWKEYLGKREALGTLIGWQSIMRTLKAEDALAAADAKAYHHALHGDRGGDLSDEDMGDLSGNAVLGNLVVNPPPQRNGLSKVAKTAVAAAALLGTGGIGLGALALLKGIQPAVEDTDTDTRIDIGTFSE